MRWKIIAALIAAVVLCLAAGTRLTEQTAQIPQAYGDVRGQDFSQLDLREVEDLLFRLSFDTKTKWPEPTLLPEGTGKASAKTSLGNGAAGSGVDWRWRYCGIHRSSPAPGPQRL